MGVMSSWELNQETDGDVNASPYGTITFADVDPGRVAFEIDLSGILDGADIHQLGLSVHDSFDGQLSIDPTSIGRADFTVLEDASIAGLGNVQWDYVVHFDNGTPVLEPLQFELYSADASFDATDLVNAPLVDANGYMTPVGVHAQRTSTPAGSETVVSVEDTHVVPEPASVIMFAMLTSMCVWTKCFKRKGKC